jgi:hypothetical protein
MFARQQFETATEERRFLCGPCRDVISRKVSESQLRVDSWNNGLIVRQSPAAKNVSTEAEGIVGINDWRSDIRLRKPSVSYSDL